MDKKALLSYIKASPNKHVNYLSEHLNIDKETLIKILEEYNLLDKVILYNSPEKELGEILIGFEKTRKIILPYEIDFYSDKYKLGVEFNGIYWHSSELKDRYYHQEKSQMAWTAGIRLYQIFEYEWKYKDLIISHIQRLCGCLKKVVCRVKEIEKEEANYFLYKTCIEYDKDFDIYFGLYELVSNDLCGVITFKGNVLNNYSERPDVSIKRGIFQGVDYFTTHYENTIYAYPDLAKYIYDYSPFKIEGCTEPNLIWFKSDKLSEEKKKYLLAGNINLSEEEYLRKLGYKKLYDCGKLKMTYNY